MDSYLAIVLTTCTLILILVTTKNTIDVYNENFHPVQKKKVPGKTVWLLWLQGWDDNTPWIVQQVRQSWEKLNPEWNIELVSERNLSDYIDIEYINHPGILAPARSDIIRLHLLAKHGGVWADATLLCMIPLDRWIYDALEPVGVWMYHGRDYGEGPASWFIVSLRGSYIARKWADAADAFWTKMIQGGGAIEYDYFWMDTLFKELRESDMHFKNDWSNVPYLWCEDHGQSHMISNRGQEDTPEIKEIILYNPPYVLKLTRHLFSDNDPDFYHTNQYAALTYAKEQTYAPYPLHEMAVVKPSYSLFAHKVAVAADCGETKDIEELHTQCQLHGFQLIVYDKCNFCKNVPSYIYSRPLINRGREGHTFLHFITKYYDNLPEEIMFIPSTLSKHKRLDRFKALFDNTGTSCKGNLGDQETFELDFYEGKKVALADTRPFRNWFEKYVGLWDPEAAGPCWNGIMRTSKERIHRHPRTFYINLLKQLSLHDVYEAAHYVERSMAAIF